MARGIIIKHQLPAHKEYKMTIKKKKKLHKVRVLQYKKILYKHIQQMINKISLHFYQKFSSILCYIFGILNIYVFATS